MGAARIAPFPKEGTAEKDFIGFAVLSIDFIPLKGEVSNHKGNFDESIYGLATKQIR